MFTILGYFLIALPFIVVFFLATRLLYDWRDTLLAFGITAVITAIVMAIFAAGIYFLSLAR